MSERKCGECEYCVVLANCPSRYCVTLNISVLPEESCGLADLLGFDPWQARDTARMWARAWEIWADTHEFSAFDPCADTDGRLMDCLWRPSSTVDMNECRECRLAYAVALAAAELGDVLTDEEWMTAGGSEEAWDAAVDRM